jgi:hypothetical protein
VFAVVIAVRSLDAAAVDFERLGLAIAARSPREQWGLETATLDISNCMVELIAPSDLTKPVAQKVQAFLDVRGAGLYLLSFEVADIDEVDGRLLANGVEVSHPPMDAPPDGGMDVRLLWPSPRSTANVFLEFLQRR